MTRYIQGKTGLGLDPFRFGAYSNMQGGAGAAGQASVDSAFNALNKQSPDYASMAQTGVAGAGYEDRANINADYGERVADMNNKYALEAQEIADSNRSEESSKNKNSNIFGSIFKAAAPLIASVALSDERSKNTIENIEDALSTLRELKPVTYYYNEEYSCNPERLHRGFIAQDYAKVMPSATYYDESTDRFAIDTQELIALLVRGIQQLEDRVARMEATKALAGVK